LDHYHYITRVLTILRITLTELAETEIINLSNTPKSVFNPDDPISEILAYFKDTGNYEAVASDGANTGLITARDLLGIEHPERTNIKSVWHQIGVTDVHFTVLLAVETLIDNNVRALLLVENGEVTGIISQVDLVKELTKVNELGQINVKDLMRTPVITIDSKIGNDRARSLMLDNKISHIPVTTDEKLKGIVTAEILVNTFIIPASRMTTGNLSGQMVPKFSGQVSGVMDTQPLKLEPDANVLEVAKEMIRMGKSACLIVDEQDMVQGIMTPRELLQPIYDLRGEAELPIYIVGLSADETWFDAAVAENKIRRVVERAHNMRPYLHEVRVQIEKQRTGGNRTRYEVRAHLYTKLGGETIHVKQEGWDLLEVFDDITQALDQILRDEKQEHEKKPRYARAREYFRYMRRSSP
jgi:CBS domain-containing protein/ribosome-associated translation inhibitor RaiA